jgi:hypothetical protein
LTSSGPASIIYNEGGQRAEEDDLDDEEPAVSAYVSRAPSPRPALESQLPVPERSYLEVPNATASARSGRSRGSPPESEGVDKGKAPQNATSGSTPSRSVSISRNIPGGIELPGPIALTDSNSSRRSGSGRLGDTLTSIWGNTPPSAGQSANSSVLPSPLEGPSSRSALINALKPLASVPEGSAIPEVVHAEPEPAGAGGVPAVYRASPPKTPKAETPYANASPSRTHGSASAAATSPNAKGTPKAASRAPTAAGSARPGGTPRGLSIYSNVAQPPPAAATPKGPISGSISPARIAPSTEAPLEQTTMWGEPEAAQTEPPTTSTPRPATRAPSPKPPSPIPPPESVEWPATESAVIQPDPAFAALEPPPSEPPAVPVPTEPAAAAEEEDSFGWGQPKSKGASRKGSKAASKAAIKAASKAASKAATPKGMETPKPPEPSSGEAGAGMSAGSPTVERPKPPSGPQSPLATVPEDHPSEPIAGAPPGDFFVTNPDETQDAPPDPSAPPAQAESTSFSSFGNPLGGSMSQNLFGAVTSGLGWGLGGGKKEEKSKPTTPGTSTPAWGGFGNVPSVTESTGGGGGGGGWGPATGNSAWGSILGSKSGNASAADLLDGAGTTDPSAQDTVQNGEPFSFIPLEGNPAPEAFAQEGDMSQGGPGFMEPLTLQTDVTAEHGADTAGPTTATADSPEVEIGGGDGGGQGGEEETGDKQPPEDDEWAIPVKGKKKKGGANAGGGAGAATPVTQAGGASAPAGDDSWAAVGGKKKKGKKR